jgi:hypothetical protein
MKYLRLICIGLLLTSSVSVGSLAEECYQGESILYQAFEGCDSLYIETPHGYSVGGPNTSRWVGRWSQSVFNQSCSYGSCSAIGYQRYTAEAECPTDGNG